jgi:thymidine kinase
MDLISTPEYEKKRTLVVIDDTQFFDLKLLLSVLKLLGNGVDILAVGLDMNSEGKPFGPMPFLMSIADEVIKLKAICEKCGKPANMTARKDKQNAHIDIGDEQYISVCRDCWISCQKKERSSSLTTIAQPPLL